MKADTRWKLIVGIGLVTLSVVLYATHYLVFHDEHHLFIFFIGDLAFVPVEVLIVSSSSTRCSSPGKDSRELRS